MGLFGGNDSAIGLSLGSSSIKLVELRRKGKGWKMTHFGMVQLPEDSVVNREIVNSVAVTESIRTLVTQLKLKNKSVCISLSGSAVIIKRMTIEVENWKELQDQVFWEAENHLPFDPSEVVMDYHLISKVQSNQADVLLVAVKTSVMDAYVNCVVDAGLQVKVVDVDYFALQNVVEANYPQNPKEAMAAIDLGAEAMKIVVIHQGVPVFTKDAVVGGRALTQEIQNHLSLSYADAEALKVGGLRDGTLPQEANELVQIASENIAVEIKRALDFYAASASDAPVGSIVLAGGGARIPGISQVVEDSIRIPTQVIHPFNAVAYDPSVFTPAYLEEMGPLAAIPIGLAMRMGAK